MDARPNVIALHISLPTLDMEASIKFYTEVFGLRVRSRTDALTQLYFGDHRISLKKTDVDSSSLQRDAQKGVRSRHIGFRVKSPGEVDQVGKELRNKGINIIAGPQDREDGRTLFCSDPSGNQIEVYYERE